MKLRALGLAACSALLLVTACEQQNSSTPAVAKNEAAQYALQNTKHFCGENAYYHCSELCKLGPRPSGSAAYEQQLRYLSQHLEQAGWSVSRHPFAAPNGTSMTNLHAHFGSAPASSTRPILLSCHIDTKMGIGPDFIGADDGASAAAVLLETARILSAQPEIAAQVELVFFDGEEAFGTHMTEEDGLYGSGFDAARRGSNLPLYQINLDMVGAKNKHIGVPFHDTAPELLSLFEESVDTLRLNPRRWEIIDASYLDDNIPFKEAGVSTLNIIAQFTNSTWWHTPRDNMSRICPQSLQESGILTLHILRQLAKLCPAR